MPPRQPDPVLLARRRQQLLERLAAVTGAAIARVWLSLPGYTDDQQERFVSLATPALLAGQGRAVDLTLAYLTRVLGEPLSFDRYAVMAKAAIDIRQPFTALARALDTGHPVDLAVQAGAARAEGVGESAVHWASRSAATAADGHERIAGWRRTLDGKACAWCQKVSTQRYKTAESASFGHLRCGCSVEPIVGDVDPGRVINSELLQQLKSPQPA